MNLYKVQCRYGRGEMTATYLVGANSEIKAKRLADQACPVPVPKNAFSVELLPDVAYTGKNPGIVSKL